MRAGLLILVITMIQLTRSDAAMAEERIVIETSDGHSVGSSHGEREKSDSQVFCSKKSEEEAAAKCKDWVAQQQKTLGDRLLTSFCSDGEISSAEGCLYRARGEIKYVLKPAKPAADSGK